MVGERLSQTVFDFFFFTNNRLFSSGNLWRIIFQFPYSLDFGCNYFGYKDTELRVLMFPFHPGAFITFGFFLALLFLSFLFLT